MKKEMGLWIDHRRVVIVSNFEQEEHIKRLTSKTGKHIRYSGVSWADGESESHHDTTEDGRDRRFDDQLNRYYDEVITYVGDATSILIMGPGEAKIEFEKRLAGHEPSDRIVAIKTVDKMSDHQIVAEVRQHFDDSKPGSNKRTGQQTAKAT
jgi:hypothetical protein